MKWWNLRLRYITIQKIRVVYKHGYKHDLWVYDLKEHKDGSYSWECFEENNKIIDVNPEDVMSIFVVKQKKRWQFYEKAGIVIDQFKPKPEKTRPQGNVVDQLKPKNESKPKSTGIVLDQFKPKPEEAQSKEKEEVFSPHKKFHNKVVATDSVQIVVKDAGKLIEPERKHKDGVNISENINIVLTPEPVSEKEHVDNVKIAENINIVLSPAWIPEKEYADAVKISENINIVLTKVSKEESSEKYISFLEDKIESLKEKNRAKPDKSENIKKDISFLKNKIKLLEDEPDKVQSIKNDISFLEKKLKSFEEKKK